MTCKACGREVPLEGINCFDCNAEGPFTRAERLAPWVRQFAWWPVLVTNGNGCGRKAWLRSIEVKEYKCFGLNRLVRLA